MKISYKIDHNKTELEDIFRDAPTKDAKMLEALMTIMNALCDERQAHESKKQFALRRGYTMSILSNMAVSMDNDAVQAKEFGRPSHMVEWIMKLAESEDGLITWSKMARDIILGDGAKLEDKEEPAKKTASCKIMKVNKDTGKPEKIDLSELPPEVLEALKKELGL